MAIFEINTSDERWRFTDRNKEVKYKRAEIYQVSFETYSMEVILELVGDGWQTKYPFYVAWKNEKELKIVKSERDKAENISDELIAITEDLINGFLIKMKDVIKFPSEPQHP